MRTRVVSKTMGVVGGLRCTPFSGIYGVPAILGDPVGLLACPLWMPPAVIVGRRPVGLLASSLYLFQ